MDNTYIFSYSHKILFLLIFLKINIPFFFFLLSHSIWVFVPWPGIEPMILALEAWSLNHQTARVVPKIQHLVYTAHFVYALDYCNC